LGAVEPVEAALDVVAFAHSRVPKLAVPLYAHIRRSLRRYSNGLCNIALI
jgi:hypothetical protein